jgi:hypothetical protein
MCGMWCESLEVDGGLVVVLWYGEGGSRVKKKERYRTLRAKSTGHFRASPQRPCDTAKANDGVREACDDAQVKDGSGRRMKLTFGAD